MNEMHLHIISFDIPYPADYGGVIDVFFKIKTLSNFGIKIHLHCFEYGSRKRQDELKKYCLEVDYYKRKTNILSHIGITPYIIKSRISKDLEDKLLQDNYPILCEGIHTCGILLNKKFGNRKIIFRPSNVEHQYYRGLARNESKILKKIFYTIEALKLKYWEKFLIKSSNILPLSYKDFEYFKNNFPSKNIIRIFPFNSDDEVKIQAGKGNYALFHGNLTVRENIDIANFIIDKIANACDYQIVIAGKNPSGELTKQISSTQNVRLISNPSEEDMSKLIAEAQIHLMFTFQPTGFKLKLLNSVFNGRFIIANREMLVGTGLETCVYKADTGEQICKKILELQDLEFSAEEIIKREKCITDDYYNHKKANVIIEMLNNDV